VSFISVRFKELLVCAVKTIKTLRKLAHHLRAMKQWSSLWCGMGDKHTATRKNIQSLVKLMFTHLENDLCRTIFALVHLIYVKMLLNFETEHRSLLPGDGEA
jgi:hypothetical protein